MPPRGKTATHIVNRVERARRLDPTLTYKRAAEQMGISLSSLDKMRAGTRTGQGSIKKRVIDPPTRSDGRGQSVINEFNVTFRSADGTRVASRNVFIEGARTGADAVMLAHDPKVKRAIQKQLAAEERDAARRKTGSPVWKSKERKGLQVTEVSRVVYASQSAFYVRYNTPMPWRRPDR
jgi:hypothetical protein